MNKQFVFIIFMFALLSSCNNDPAIQQGDAHSAQNANKTDTTEGPANSIMQPGNTAAVTGLTIEPSLIATDSIQVLFFDDPDGDSLRYTRFYKYVASGDSIITNTVLRNLNQPFEKLPAVNKCRSEGKIYMFVGDDPVKTLYFSTRSVSCYFLYLINNGAFIYFPMSDSLSKHLRHLKKYAKKP